jgi:ATP-dependent RNA helicase DeaD
MATYRISVGRRHRIAPRQIVGALANEGGLAREDFGRIEIRATHSLVDLPAELPPAVWKALASTRISGQRIELRLDRGAEAPAKRGHGGDPRPKRGKPGKLKKPRH